MGLDNGTVGLLPWFELAKTPMGEWPTAMVAEPCTPDDWKLTQ